VTVGISDWFDWAYWGFAFLAALCCVELYMAECGDELQGAVSLNLITWFVAALVLILVVKAAGGDLLHETSQGLSGYKVNVELPDVAGMPMVRATGISRFAGAIGLIAFAFLWTEKRWQQALALAVFAGTAWLLWVMQARGSTVSFLGGLAVMLWLLGGRARRLGVGLIAVVLFAIGLDYISHSNLEYIWRFATRNDPHIRTMHGRTGIYRDVWDSFSRSPIIGFGPQADRRILFTNAQNGTLYALLCGGIIGGGAWILGFLVALSYIVRGALDSEIIPAGHKVMFVQAAGLMAFFALRSIPENTAALFSVDLMLQLPAMVYLGVMVRAARDQPGFEYARDLRHGAVQTSVTLQNSLYQ
jgi:O-antigen ligase